MSNKKLQVIIPCSYKSINNKLKQVKEIAKEQPQYSFQLIILKKGNPEATLLEQSKEFNNINILVYPSNRKIETHIFILQVLRVCNINKVFFLMNPSKLKLVKSWSTLFNPFRCICINNEFIGVLLNRKKTLKKLSKDISFANYMRKKINKSVSLYN